MVSTRSAATAAAAAWSPPTVRAAALSAGAGRRSTDRTGTLENFCVVGVEAHLDPEGGGGAQVGLDLVGPAGGNLELEVHGVHRVGLAHHPGLEGDDVDLVGGEDLGDARDQAGRSAP